MEIVCSPVGVMDRDCLGQGMRDIVGAGFSEVMMDLSLYCTDREIEGGGRDRRHGQVCRVLQGANPLALQDEAEVFLQLTSGHGLHSTVAYMPYLLTDTKLGDCSALLKRLAKESILACRHVGCRYLVVRPLFSGVEKKELWDVNRAFYLGLVDVAKDAGVTILLENQCRSVNGHMVRGACSEPEEAAAWVDALNEACGEEWFGFCFHVGTASLCGMDLYGFATTVGARLKVLILSDTDGRTEGGFLPFTMVEKGTSKTDWSRLMSGLREIDFDGIMVLSLGDTVKAFPLSLRGEVLRLAKKIGQQFQEQLASDIDALLQRYPQRVLFGAGNLCRIYMRVFGEKYPPIFITDNNAKIWGTEICGLPVRSPAELSTISEDCAIVICNVFHHQSIRGQIEGMGLRNPALVLNDEYLFSSKKNVYEKGHDAKK